MKLILMLISLSLGTAAVIQTVELMHKAERVMESLPH